MTSVRVQVVTQRWRHHVRAGRVSNASKAKGCPGVLRDAKGCSEMPRDAQGCPGVLRDALGCPWILRDAQGCPGMPRDSQGCPGSPGMPRVTVPPEASGLETDFPVSLSMTSCV